MEGDEGRGRLRREDGTRNRPRKKQAVPLLAGWAGDVVIKY